MLTDHTAGDPAVSLAVAAYRHHRRLELRELHPPGADPPWTAHRTLDARPPLPRS